jgi:hypothetical protein
MPEGEGNALLATAKPDPPDHLAKDAKVYITTSIVSYFRVCEK